MEYFSRGHSESEPQHTSPIRFRFQTLFAINTPFSIIPQRSFSDEKKMQLPLETEALVVKATGGQFEMTPIVLQDLRPDEVLVEMKYSGVCHTVLCIRLLSWRSQETNVFCLGLLSAAGRPGWTRRVSSHCRPRGRRHCPGHRGRSQGQIPPSRRPGPTLVHRLRRLRVLSR
jgi:hypothetical protein